MTREILSPLTRLWRGLIGAVVMLSTGLFAAGFAAAQEFHYIHGGNINDVFFVGNLGWTAEDGGRIRYSQDGGNTWLLAGVPDHVRGDLRGLFFLSPDMGWAVGEGGVVLQSVPLTNGQAWADVNANNRVTNSVTNVSTPCNTSEAELYDIFMTTPMDGWAVGLDGAVRRTANNWGAFSSPTTIPHKYTCVDDPYDAYKIHFFLDSGVSPTPAFSKGVIASEFGQVLTTDDGGDNWVTHLVDPNGAACPVPDGPNIEFWDLVFDSPLVHTSPGWIVGGVGNNNGYLFRTSSGGTDGTWTQSKCLNFLDPDDPATKLICGLSTGYGLAVLGTAPNPQAISGGYGSQILVHEPGFGNFDPCNCNSCGGPPFPYPCSVACGAPGTTSWVEKGVPLPSDNSKAAPAFFCATAITTTAACLGGMFGRIVRYENNVATDKATVDFLRLNDGAFRSNGTDGCAIGQGHIIKVTTDGGASWDDGYNPAYIGSKSGNALKLADNSTYGAAVGSGGFVAHSSSAITPNSWSTTATSPTGNDLYDLAFVPGTTDFFVVGSGGLVDKTSNQGASWAVLSRAPHVTARRA